MRRLLLIWVCSASVAAAASGVRAEDAPADASGYTYDWSGAYMGLSFGSVEPRAFSDTGGLDDAPFDDETATGVFGGYLRQDGRLVYGGELHFTPYDSTAVTAPSDGIEDIFELRGRVGYAFDRVLVSATLGFATQGYADTATPLTADLTGFTYGVGIDYGVSDRFLLGLEYIARDVEDDGVPAKSNVTVRDDSIRIRAGFRF